MSVRPLAWVASTVVRLTMSLGNPGQGPVVIREIPTITDGSTRNRSASTEARTPIRRRTARTGSRSCARAPVTSTSPPVTAPTTAQVPASM